MSKQDDSAFPVVYDMTGDPRVHEGLTKRELFAAMAMCRLAEVSNDEWVGASKNVKSVAKMSVAYADALLAELAKVGE